MLKQTHSEKKVHEKHIFILIDAAIRRRRDRHRLRKQTYRFDVPLKDLHVEKTSAPIGAWK